MEEWTGRAQGPNEKQNALRPLRFKVLARKSIDAEGAEKGRRERGEANPV